MANPITQTELTDAQIRQIFMANGFKAKDGGWDLKDYVYAAARELIAADRALGKARDQ